METKFDEWCVLELMGHRRLAGKVSNAVIGGGAFLRIDIPRKDDQWTTQYYSPGAVYCITPTTEQIAREVAKQNEPEPVHRWEIKQLTIPRWEYCSYRLNCKKEIMCNDCEVHIEGCNKDLQGSWSGEELEDEP